MNKHLPLLPPELPHCYFCHLSQFWIHYLICFSQNWNQVISMFHVVGCEKSISCSCLLVAAYTSNAVNVILRWRRIIEVDHKFHIFNVRNQQCLVSSSDCTFIINITIKYNTNNCIIKLLENKMQINLSITFGGLLDPKVCALYNPDWQFISHDNYSTS